MQRKPSGLWGFSLLLEGASEPTPAWPSATPSPAFPLADDHLISFIPWSGKFYFNLSTRSVVSAFPVAAAGRGDGVGGQAVVFMGGWLLHPHRLAGDGDRRGSQSAFLAQLDLSGFEVKGSFPAGFNADDYIQRSASGAPQTDVQPISKTSGFWSGLGSTYSIINHVQVVVLGSKGAATMIYNGAPAFKCSPSGEKERTPTQTRMRTSGSDKLSSVPYSGYVTLAKSRKPSSLSILICKMWIIIVPYRLNHTHTHTHAVIKLRSVHHGS